MMTTGRTQAAKRIHAIPALPYLTAGIPLPLTTVGVNDVSGVVDHLTFSVLQCQEARLERSDFTSLPIDSTSSPLSVACFVTSWFPAAI